MGLYLDAILLHEFTFLVLHEGHDGVLGEANAQFLLQVMSELHCKEIRTFHDQ